jgi:hypothetical protein
MFGSKTVLAHILRGVIGLSALALAILVARNTDTASVCASVTLAIVALIALRGCPMCWTIGLFETLRGKAPHIHRTAGNSHHARSQGRTFIRSPLSSAPTSRGPSRAIR